MTQARAYGVGVGVAIATQNPMALDYRALSNAGLWCLGRLQTDADRERVLDGLSGDAAQGHTAEELSHVLKRLAPQGRLHSDAAPLGDVAITRADDAGGDPAGTCGLKVGCETV